MTAVAEPASPSPAEAAEQPVNPQVALIGQILCVVLPLIIWFAPLDLEPQTKHAFAIVAFMVVAWMTQAMDYALTGFHRLLSVLGARHRSLSGGVLRLCQ